MKKLFKELKRVNEMIDEANTNLSNINQMTYYKVFGTEEEKQNDIKEVYKSLKVFNDLKYTLLENIQTSCEIEKMKLSKQQTLKAIA